VTQTLTIGGTITGGILRAVNTAKPIVWDDMQAIDDNPHACPYAFSGGTVKVELDP
jgi:hypothetical protein